MSTIVKSDKPQQIQVFVRTRPISKMEREGRSTNCIELLGPKDLSVKMPHGKKYTFDKVFGPNTKQVDVYLTVVHPLIAEVMAGYNCTVFAYGQTGAGKTYTMAGGSELTDSVSWQDDETAGIIPRALAHLFEELRLLQQEYTVRVSYLELYNEELYDLLADSDDNSRMRIFEDQHQKGSVIIQGIEERTVLNKNEVYKILQKGQEKRRTATTLMNAQSSRSHTVFTITVHTRETTVEGELVVKTGKLHLVDLAGSENIGKSGAVEKRAREAGSINQSLLTLGRVIKALVERSLHIPYRESKLTRILQDSLGGRTKTSIIANISLASSNLEETISTLDYANRARNITNRPEVNLRMSQKTLILQYCDEIDRLRKDLSASRTGTGGVYIAQDNYDKLIVDNEINKEEIAEKIVQIREVQSKLKSVHEEKQRIEEEWHNLEISFNQTTKHLNHVSTMLEKAVKEKTEEQYLSKCFEVKSVQLYEEANRLLQFAKTSLHNEDLLHKRIESIREIANKNVQSVQPVIKKVSNLEEMVTNSLMQHMKLSSEVNQNITKALNTIHKGTTEMQHQNFKFKNELLEQINTSSGSIFNNFSETQRNSLEQWINDVHSNCAHTLVKQKTVHDEESDLFTDLLNLMDKNQKQYEDSCINITGQIQDLRKSYQECVSHTENHVQKMLDALLPEFAAMDSCFGKQLKNTNMHFQRAQKNKKGVERIASLISQLSNEVPQLMDYAISNGNDILNYTKANQDCKDLLHHVKSTLEVELPSVLDAMNETGQEIRQVEFDLTNKMDLQRQHQIISDTTKRELIKQIKTHTNSREEAIINETQILIDAVSNINEDVKTKQTENGDKCKLSVQNHIETINTVLSIKYDTNEKMFSSCAENVGVMEKHMLELQRSTDTNRQLLESSCSSFQEHFNVLNENLVEINRSGDTPVRSQLSSFKVLQPTPRQQILMQYKQNIQIPHNETSPFREMSAASSSNFLNINSPLTSLKTTELSDSTEDSKENLETSDF